MPIKSVSILLFSSLIGVGANADAATPHGVAMQPQVQITPFIAWLAANGRMAIELQSEDNQNHHHGADLHADGVEASPSSASDNSHSGGSHGGRR